MQQAFTNLNLQASIELTKMRTLLLSWLLFTLYIAPFFSISFVCGSSQCRSDQQEFLLGFKNSLVSSSSAKLVKWNESTDCCFWDGITCDASGRVIELDLSNQSISGAIDKSNSLFRIRHLQQLNLAYNTFTSEFPSGFENLTNLSYLNLSNAGFVGQIPVGISRLKKLVTLDLSVSSLLTLRPLKLENPNIAMLVRNLTRLKHLYLDGVNASANGDEWSRILPSLLPNLQVLSMSSCYLSGPISPSLAKLKSLSIINLDRNNLSGPFPKFLAEFRNLTSLHLASNNLRGRVPDETLQAPNLQALDLSFNKFLQGSFRNFPSNASLRTLVVRDTNFGGQLPESIGKLEQLTRTNLRNCKFNGTIPKTLEKLTQLIHLDLSFNNLSGPVPSLASLRNLTELNLAGNQLNGSILSSNWSSLPNLVSLNFGQNSLSGNVPSTLFRSPSLKQIDLSQNLFTGGLSEVKGDQFSSSLELIDLSHNMLQGPIPMFVYEIQCLKVLSLSWNKFSGVILMSSFRKLKNLIALDLSYNNLSIDSSSTNSSSPLATTITRLELASCNVTKFPDYLQKVPALSHLDLSSNRIHGEIPSWIWKTQRLGHLNLSMNFLVKLGRPSHVTSPLIVVDLHGNQLQGNEPIFPPSVAYLDYSNNNFDSVVPHEIGDFLRFAYFFSLSGNNFHGSIPESICNNQYLEVLDLSNNSLTGPIPECLIQMSLSLGVLNLKRNKLSGIIPDTFPENCSLQTLDLNRNRLGGKVPKSLANCMTLEVLDFGNNRISDSFPCHLKSISSLRVLVLRSNEFKRDVNCRRNNITWSMLQIIDLAHNSFTGELPQELLMTWNAMKANQDDPYPGHLGFEVLVFGEKLFHDSITVIMKGLELELVKILTIFTSIDFSSNKFEGRIPKAIGDLKALYMLNLSNNALTGTVPSLLGNLPKLEALDLSSNDLNGQIPLQLANLNFLSFLNLSNNMLTGKIPSGTQLQSFSGASFANNARLCGLPLDVQCESPSDTKDYYSDYEIRNNIDWNSISVEMGFVFGLGVAIVPLMFWKRWRVWYYTRTDRVLYKFFPKLDRRYRYRGTIARWPQRRSP